MYYYIEPMVESDISDVQKVERNSFSTPWSTNTYRRELRNPSSSRYIVVRASPSPPPPRRDTKLEASPVQRNGLFGMLLGSLFGTHGVANAELNQWPIVGYGGIWLTVDDAHITTIAVDPRYRGHGLGELLLNGLIDQSLDMHATMLTLEVRVSNVVAQNLYRKYGFYVAGTRPRYYTDNGEDALIMWTHSIRTPTYRAQLGELRRQLFARLRGQAEATARPSGQDMFIQRHETFLQDQ